MMTTLCISMLDSVIAEMSDSLKSPRDDLFDKVSDLVLL